jgi:hypothetical protein
LMHASLWGTALELSGSPSPGGEQTGEQIQQH